VNTKEIVQASLRDEQLKSRWLHFWSAWNDAATYPLDNGLSPDEALKYPTDPFSSKSGSRTW